jgi:uncharacterized repeat protein (TIGR02543 family)
MKYLTKRIPALSGIILLAAVMVFLPASCQNESDPGNDPQIPAALQGTAWSDADGNELAFTKTGVTVTTASGQQQFGIIDTVKDGETTTLYFSESKNADYIVYSNLINVVIEVNLKGIHNEGWEKEGLTPAEYWSITWNLNGGAFASGSSHPAQIEKGALLSKPSPDPAKDGNAFSGWYTDSALTQAYNFTGPVTANLNLYAKWEEGSQPTAEITVTAGNTLAAKLQWVRDNQQSDTAYIIEVNADEDIPYQLCGSLTKSNITIILTGKEQERIIRPTSNIYGNFFLVRANTTLILDNNITLQARDNLCSSVRIDGGTLIMNDGSKISGNTATAYIGSSNDPTIGGGVYVQYGYELNSSGGTFIMNGGEISGNCADYGGGVYVGGGVQYRNDGTFIMNGGLISGNTSNERGGGVYTNGTFTMSGGVISGNTGIGAGGGVYVYYTNGTFTKSGGTIYGYSEDDPVYSNTVKYNSNIVYNEGHAVYGGSNTKYRDTTAGPTVNLDSTKSGAAGGWEN